MSWYAFKPYVSVAQRQRNAAREVAKLAKKGRLISPVRIDGKKIVATFWGKAWCENLEAYSDFSNRLPRGRSYVRNGSVVDLQIQAGKITALVSGSDLYTVAIKIDTLPNTCWKSLKAKCAGQIGSLVELLQGRLSKSVMELVTQQENGLFPKPREISIECSCPDWADLCKHSAAVLYGVGARLDQEPEMFFKLRNVDHLELVAEAVAAPATHGRSQRGKKTIAASELSDVFGIELAEPMSADLQSTEKPSVVKALRKKQPKKAKAKAPKTKAQKPKTIAANAAAKAAPRRRITTKKDSRRTTSRRVPRNGN